ncbi:hypothetical protein [Streptomyces cathayae]|uniref:Uncharacterized protein n=1 Tax=Streptomyces cathayae TaxID=3031124 RepID=A0ABY8JUW7_9ACTN|nr:hypothetical protein [Streptomyces sp. HUAS 5]WGD39782.1 hypothetical protein PYS65_06365 [Streptomyces sp. HUAS 5]
MYPPELDLRLDGFEAADEQTQEAFWRAIQIEQTELTPLAEHHTPDGASYHVLHNGAVTWGIPGEPQLVALHLQRDPATKTFRFAHATLPLPAMAQSWLIHRGCPPKEISLAPGTGTTPADETTRALEQRLMSDGDHFALLHSYTDDDPENSATVVVLRSLDEHSPSPFRVLHEDVDTDSWTHTLREGGFATYAEALQWCDDALSGEAPPLPPVQPPVRSAQRPANSLPVPAQRPAGRSR